MFRFFRKTKEENQATDAEWNGDQSRVKETVLPAMSVHPEWKIPEEDYYFYLYHNAQLPEVFPHEVAVETIVARKRKNGALVIRALIRNGLNTPLRPGGQVVTVYQKDEGVVAQKEIIMDGIGVIPARSTRPWLFEFTYNETVRTASDPSTWKLAIVPEKMPVKQDILLPQDWLTALGTGGQQDMEEEMTRLAKEAPAEAFSMEGVDVLHYDDGLHFQLVLHNRTYEMIHLSQYLVSIYDVSGTMQFTGSCPESLPVLNRYTSMLIDFTVPEEEVPKEADWQAFSVSLKKKA